MEVQDKPTENGIKLNNILTALILGVMSWVGVNITTMKDDISLMRTDFAVNKNELSHLRTALNEHISEYKANLERSKHAD